MGLYRKRVFPRNSPPRYSCVIMWVRELALIYLPFACLVVGAWSGSMWGGRELGLFREGLFRGSSVSASIFILSTVWKILEKKFHVFWAQKLKFSLTMLKRAFCPRLRNFSRGKITLSLPLLWTWLSAVKDKKLFSDSTRVTTCFQFQNLEMWMHSV